jgi:HSP20 family protein
MAIDKNQQQPQSGQQQPQQNVQPQGTQRGGQGSQERQGQALQRQQGSVQRGRQDPFSQMLAPFSMGPFAWMRRMLDDMDQLMSISPFGRSEGFGGQQLFVPQVDVSQQGDRIVVHADLPGLSPDDVRLQVVEGALVIEGERKSEREQETGGVMRTERYFGQFQRVVPLPEGADPDSAEARFENGVLEVIIRAPQRAGARNIQIRSGAQQPRKEGTQH